MTRMSVFAIWVSLAMQASIAAEQQIADLGACDLQSGSAIGECRVGYRTYGALGPERSNVLLFPTWYTGTTEQLENDGYIGPGRLADSGRYFVVAVDALGNGVSSSPSNSRTQAGERFPDITIADMVDSQHRLLTETLEISRVHAIVGISMGGMQALEWAVRYPAFANKVVSISGTPRQTAYDVIFWETERTIATTVGRRDPETALLLTAGMTALHLQTPDRVIETVPDTGYPQLIANDVASAREYGLQNRVPQLGAMLTHDISAGFGGSFESAAQAMDADLLIIVDADDQLVNPLPSAHFAEIAGAQFREFDSGCGHLLVACEREAVAATVNLFLAR